LTKLAEYFKNRCIGATIFANYRYCFADRPGLWREHRRICKT